MKRYHLLLLCFALLLGFIPVICADAPGPFYDTVILHGRVLNPETRMDLITNIGISKGRITAISAEPLHGKQVIDATGLVVAPGFIDILSYDPNSVGNWNKLADGVTTNIGMHGTTVYPETWYPAFERQKLPLHFGGSFFYTMARSNLGLGRYQAASPAQIQKLTVLAENSLKNGCLGISLSLEYVPGISPVECLAMMRVAKKYDVGVYYHTRYSDMEPPGTNLDGLEEVIGYVKETGAAIHIDHINSTGGTFSMKESLAMLNQARDKGMDITACMYPYNYWATYLNSARFDPGWQSRFHITYSDLQLGGSTERLTAETFVKYQKLGKLVDAYAIPEADVVEGLRCPWMIIASDGILEPGYNNHPRASGMCARLIGRYARDQKVLSLMDAVAKLTVLPARRLEKHAPALRRKGRINVGADADIVIFDYKKIIDRATPEHPEYTSDGICYVLVDGGVVKDLKGFNRNVRNGHGIKAEFTGIK